jgi:8-oxo-dGTP pyrophosphatase MutT (NUDIX family)
MGETGAVSTERWVRCSLGHDHWGSSGAAGLLLFHRDGDALWLLLQHRAAWTHQGDTWSTPGGALREGEAAIEGAFREVGEETGLDLHPRVEVVGTYVDDHGGWSYSTVIASAGSRLDPTDVALHVRPGAAVGHLEQEQVAWVAVTDLTSLPLHPGFASSWPVIEAMLAE